MSPVLAHAFGERYDSPVPLALFLLGTVAFRRRDLAEI